MDARDDLCRLRKQGSCLAKEIMQETMPGARRRGRPRTASMDNIKTWTGLPVEKLIRMTAGRDKWRKYVHGGSVAEWLACWTQAQKGPVQIGVATLSGNSLRQTAHTHCASVHHAAKLVAALFRVAWVTAGLAESNGRLLPGL